VIERIDEINRRRKKRSGGKYAAHHAFSACRRFFGWAIERDIYGIEASPCANINIKRLVGSKDRRDRVLTDAELALVWQVAGKIGQPFGPLVRALLLTGQRLSEIAEARWSEINTEAALLVVPRARMKMKQTHSVPLTPAMIALLEAMPRFDHKGSDFIFTTTGGRRPISGFSKAKQRLDEEISPAGVPHFTLHDLRRTVRTRLSALGVTRTVAELTIGHAQQGIEAVYDVHSYDHEKRDALARWERALLAIVDPARQVADLATARQRKARP
jgi:integrase